MYLKKLVHHYACYLVIVQFVVTKRTNYWKSIISPILKKLYVFLLEWIDYIVYAHSYNIRALRLHRKETCMPPMHIKCAPMHMLRVKIDP